MLFVKLAFCNLSGGSENWRCEFCHTHLFSKAGYTDKVKSYCNFKSQDTSPYSNACAICGKVCKSSPALKRRENS